nr:hypothetical protein P5658_10825 [Bacillus subtilis]
MNAIQVGGYKPSTVIDFEIPKRYGLRQTIADTVGIGGIFRSLRTIPVLFDIAKDMEEMCPDAWFLNYTNPMNHPYRRHAPLYQYQNNRALPQCSSLHEGFI